MDKSDTQSHNPKIEMKDEIDEQKNKNECCKCCKCCKCCNSCKYCKCCDSCICANLCICDDDGGCLEIVTGFCMCCMCVTEILSMFA